MSYILRSNFVTKGISLVVILTFVMGFVMVDFTPAHAGFLGGVVKAITRPFKKIAKGVSGVFKKVTSGVSKVFGKIGGKVGGFLGKVGSFIKKKVVPLVSKAAPIVAAVASIAAPYLAPAFASIATSVAAAAKVAGSVATLIKSKGKNLLGAIVGMAGSFGGTGVFGGIMNKVSTFAGKISKGIDMLKSGNIGGLLTSLSSVKGMPFASTLSSLGSSTTAAGNGFKGLFTALGNKVMNSPIAQKLIGGATNMLTAAKGKIPGVAGNLKGIVGKIAGTFTSAAAKDPKSIFGRIGTFINKKGLIGKSNVFIDKLAQKLTSKIDTTITKITKFKVGKLVDKYAAKYGSKLASKVVGSKRIGKFQKLLGDVQSFAAEAQKNQINVVEMYKKAELSMVRNGKKTRDQALKNLLGMVDTSAFRADANKKIDKIKNKRVRKYLKKVMKKLPPDMKLRQKIREGISKYLK